MLRLMLKDELWSKLEEIMLQHRIYGKPNLYIGSLSDIIKRVWEHNNKVIPGFTAKYNVLTLVDDEMHALSIEAVRREKRFKNRPMI